MKDHNQFPKHKYYHRVILSGVNPGKISLDLYSNCKIKTRSDYVWLHNMCEEEIKLKSPNFEGVPIVENILTFINNK